MAIYLQIPFYLCRFGSETPVQAVMQSMLHYSEFVQYCTCGIYGCKMFHVPGGIVTFSFDQSIKYNTNVY